MDSILSLIVHFFTEDTITNNINIPILLLVLGILLFILGICIFVSKKNMLYVKRIDKDDEITDLLKGNEVA